VLQKLERQSEKCTHATKQGDVSNELPDAGTDLEDDDADILLEECPDSDNTEHSDPEPEEEDDEYRGVKVILSPMYFVVVPSYQLNHLTKQPLKLLYMLKNIFYGR
jgi:hypothetical protein